MVIYGYRLLKKVASAHLWKIDFKQFYVVKYLCVCRLPAAADRDTALAAPAMALQQPTEGFPSTSYLLLTTPAD